MNLVMVDLSIRTGLFQRDDVESEVLYKHVTFGFGILSNKGNVTNYLSKQICI